MDDALVDLWRSRLPSLDVVPTPGHWTRLDGEKVFFRVRLRQVHGRGLRLEHQSMTPEPHSACLPASRHRHRRRRHLQLTG